MVGAIVVVLAVLGLVLRSARKTERGRRMLRSINVMDAASKAGASTRDVDDRAKPNVESPGAVPSLTLDVELSSDVPSLTLFDCLMIRLRILISMVQVLSQLGVVYAIRFSPLFAHLVRWMGLFELNFLQVLPFDCVLDLSFHGALLIRTLALPVLGVVMALASVANPKLRELIKTKGVAKGLASAASRKLLELTKSVLFVGLFLIYPSTSAAIFSTFQCEPLEDGSRWLRADLSVDCDSTAHGLATAYAVLMVLVYPVGTPLVFAYFLRRESALLKQIRFHEKAAVADRLAGLPIVERRLLQQMLARFGVWQMPLNE